MRMLSVEQCEERCRHKGKAETCGPGFAGCGQLSRYQEGRLERKRLDRVARVGGVGEGMLERQERE